MSAIFPTKPPSAQIHLLPKNSHFISYNVDDSLNISAWMKDEFLTIDQCNKLSNDEYYEEHCDNCNRSKYNFLNEYTDKDGEVDWDRIEGGEDNFCNVYDDGYHGQYCIYGYDKEEINNFTVAPMVFTISLSLTNFKTLNDRDRAFLQAAILENNHIYTTNRYMASNVHGDEDSPSHICWGDNSQPQDLRSIVFDYSNTPFNDDLVTLDAFEDNCHRLRRKMKEDEFLNRSKDTFLCLGQDADALLIVSAEDNIPTFFTLLSAGFKSLSKAPHIMLIPLKQTEIVKDGLNYNGYQTPTDAVNRNWFVTMNGLLVGQI